jgi:hypothetical protein
LSVLLVGAEGNMGKRYQAVMRFLGKDYVGVDKQHNRHYVAQQAMAADGIIIATPTETHLELLTEFLQYGKPVMCEKPLCKDPKGLSEVLDLYRKAATPLNMIYQYQELVNPLSVGNTVYDYYRHGSDGLAWDCIQIIGLAKGALEIAEASPYWTCAINGWSLDLSDMDGAYVNHIERWMREPGQDLGELQAIHDKTYELKRVGIYGRNY